MKYQVEATDNHNPSKVHCFRKESGKVFYNQKICGSVQYDDVHVEEDCFGYAEYYPHWNAPETCKEVNSLIKQARNKARNVAEKEGWNFIKSRGVTINYIDENGVRGNEPVWLKNGVFTKSALRDLIGENRTYYLEGGFDGSEYIEFDDYMPWVSEWSVDLDISNISL